jgi:hypothetical protein
LVTSVPALARTTISVEAVLLLGLFFFVRVLTPNRFHTALLILAIFFLGWSEQVRAQDEDDSVPLGDIARSLRRQEAAPKPETVIDNDNLSQVMENAENRRAGDSSLLYSLDPGSNSFHVSSPDVTCSLSFSANSSSLLADPAMNDLPRTEMAKLAGPASIDGDTLQVTVHNGSSWDLREVVVGLTIVRPRDAGSVASYYGNAKMVPAVAGAFGSDQDSTAKQPDVTVILHMKGSAAPSSTAIFRTALNFELFPDQEWHWAIVKAKGIAPQENPAELAGPDQVSGANVVAPDASSALDNRLSAIPSLPALPPTGSALPNRPNPARSAANAQAASVSTLH